MLGLFLLSGSNAHNPHAIIFTRMKHKHSRSGFTIVELLIVIIVIGILAALVLIAYSNVTNQAKVTTLQGDLTQAAKQLNIDRENGGGTSFPASLSAANNGNGLNPSQGGTYTYTANNTVSPATYCLQESANGLTYYVLATGANYGPPAPGTCQTFGVPLAWWALNNNANDSGTNGINGTISGATATTGQNGTATNAYLFSPSNTISFSNALFNQSYGALTLSGWYKPTTATSGEFAIFKKDPVFELGVMNNTAVRDLVATTGGTNGWTSSNDTSYTFNLNQWYFLAMTWNGTQMTQYVNGTAIKTVTVSGTMITNSSAVVMNGLATMNGAIDDARIYTKALTGNEIAALYNLGAQ